MITSRFISLLRKNYLNPDVTKNLFQAISSKLTICQRSHRAEVMTIFLPLESAPTRDR
jgi:hypothetical protein